MLLGSLVSPVLGPATTAHAAPEPVLTVDTGLVIGFPGGGWAERTTAAVGSGQHPDCLEGRLFFMSGQQVKGTTLEGALVLNQAFPTPVPPEETYEPLLIFDNHIVATNGGDLIATYEGVTINDNMTPRPAWWETTETYPAYEKDHVHPGGRGNPYVWRSTDCGATWLRLPDLDSATASSNSLATRLATYSRHGRRMAAGSRSRALGTRASTYTL